MLSLLAMLAAAPGCRDKSKRTPMSDQFPSWIPLLGEPLPGHGGRPAMKDAPYRRLTVDELRAVAYTFHPRISLAEMEVMPMEDWDGRFWRSPERQALNQVLRTGYGKLARWQELCRAVRRAVPPAYTVAERTSPFNDPAYLIVVDAPVAPGTIDENHLLVHVSYLVPYYFYFEVHSRRIDGKIQRDPWVYEVTPVFADVLAAIEREIEARYGYDRMTPDVALVDVPGIFINGYDGDMEGIPPTLRDALFSPHGW